MRFVKNRYPVILWLALLAGLFTAAGGTITPVIAQNAEAETECDIHEGPCSLDLDGREVKLEISPKPVKAMKDLTFTVEVSGPALSDPPHIDLDMPDMEMGRNRVEMKEQDENTYTGTGVIVKCPSGKKTWQAVITIPETGKAAFVFDVVY
ncbi:MAG: hypothetical protein ACQETG_12200 [Thermodesulfobacteriota bacterium]